jgi:hypothetical protein
MPAPPGTYSTYMKASKIATTALKTRRDVAVAKAKVADEFFHKRWRIDARRSAEIVSLLDMAKKGKLRKEQMHALFEHVKESIKMVEETEKFAKDFGEIAKELSGPAHAVMRAAPAGLRAITQAERAGPAPSPEALKAAAAQSLIVALTLFFMAMRKWWSR